MDWKFFWATFLSIFVAELGDKTQLGVLSLTVAGKSPGTIFVAASLALILSTLIGVFAGNLLSRFMDPKHLRIAAGILFIAIGIWTLVRGD